jgi:poly(A) polymerase
MKTETREPVILPRSVHPISRKEIDPDALKVLYRLNRSGFKAYLVGGAVRDLLLRKKPKDFDVATDARPGQIKKLFGNCFLIGRRFRLAHIRFKGGKIIEVATFRREPEETAEGEAETETDRNNTFGTPREDAFRRDITINALFYDIATFSIIDYVGGLEDISQRKVCIIGDPSERYIEDPVRIWRVLRHAARHNFTIEEKTARAIETHRELMAKCSGARLFEELNRDLSSGFASPFFRLLATYKVLPIVLGEIGRKIEQTDGKKDDLFKLLSILDGAMRRGETRSQDVSYGILFWPWVQWALLEKGHLPGDKMKLLTDEFMASTMSITIPKGLRSNIINTLYILDRMMHAMQTGRMKWTLTKRARYSDAVTVFSLLEHGLIKHGEDSFVAAFRMKFPAQKGMGHHRRKRHSRYRNGAPAITKMHHDNVIITSSR